MYIYITFARGKVDGLVSNAALYHLPKKDQCKFARDCVPNISLTSSAPQYISYTCMHLYIYMHVHVYIYTMYIYIHDIYIYIYICIYIYIYTCIHTHTYIRNMFDHTICVYVCVYTYIYIACSKFLDLCFGIP